jgi:hypothetical protein
MAAMAVVDLTLSEDEDEGGEGPFVPPPPPLVPSPAPSSPGKADDDAGVSATGYQAPLWCFSITRQR